MLSCVLDGRKDWTQGKQGPAREDHRDVIDLDNDSDD